MLPERSTASSRSRPVIGSDTLFINGYGSTENEPGQKVEIPPADTVWPTADADHNGAVVLPVGTTLEKGERELIEKTLASVNNNKTRAAAILGTTPKTLHNKARRWRSEAAQMAEH